MKACALCGNEIPKKRNGRAMYCSNDCYKKKLSDEYRAARGQTDLPRVPTGTTGAVAELAVSADLLRSGYEVMRALSPSCSCDLAIIVGTKVLRVEVRSGWKNKRGELKWPQKKQDKDKQDIWAVVHGDLEIQYFPDKNNWS